MKEENPKEKSEIMENTKKQILKTSIVAAIIFIFFLGIYMAFSILQDGMFSRIWQVVTMALLVVAIIVFEVAYKKDSGIIAISGIELFVLSCYTLTLEYIKTRFGLDVKIYNTLFCSIYVVYYVLKDFIMYTSGRKQVLNSLSDIADIVKEDSPKKKKAVKHNKGEG